MSLLRLLTAGKSLVQSKEGNRYRVTSQRLLPKFESKKTPFGGGPGEADTSAPEPAAAPAVAIANAPTPAPIVTEAAQTQGLFGRLRIWIGARFTRSPKLELPRLGKGPVQTELSLDRVRVVRNDLSDADLEVVPAKKTKSAPAVKPGTAAPPESEPATAKPQTTPQHRPARLSSRLFAAGKH